MNAILLKHGISESDYPEFQELVKGRIDNHEFGDRLLSLPNYRKAYRQLLAFVSAPFLAELGL